MTRGHISHICGSDFYDTWTNRIGSKNEILKTVQFSVSSAQATLLF
jgi:hypothetical protein